MGSGLRLLPKTKRTAAVQVTLLVASATGVHRPVFTRQNVLPMPLSNQPLFSSSDTNSKAAGDQADTSNSAQTQAQREIPGRQHGLAGESPVLQVMGDEAGNEQRRSQAR